MIASVASVVAACICFAYCCPLAAAQRVTAVIDTSMTQIGAFTLAEPSGIARDSRGTIYLSDAGLHRVFCLDSSFRMIRQIGGLGGGAGSFNRPAGIAVDNDLNLLVVDQGNRRVCRFDSKLHYSGDLALGPDSIGELFEPSSVAALGDGSIWVADRRHNRIAVINSGGQFDRYIGDFGSPGGSLFSPEKLVPVPDRIVLVADKGNHRVVLYDWFGSYKQSLELPSQVEPIAAALIASDIRHVTLLAKGGGIWQQTAAGLTQILIPQITQDGQTAHFSDLVHLSSTRLLVSSPEPPGRVIALTLYPTN